MQSSAWRVRVPAYCTSLAPGLQYTYRIVMYISSGEKDAIGSNALSMQAHSSPIIYDFLPLKRKPSRSCEPANLVTPDVQRLTVDTGERKDCPTNILACGSLIPSQNRLTYKIRKQALLQAASSRLYSQIYDSIYAPLTCFLTCPIRLQQQRRLWLDSIFSAFNLMRG